MTPAERSATTRSRAHAAAVHEQTLRARWEATQDSLRQRFDHPIERATRITRRTLGWFPVRVWRYFLRSNGFLLAAGLGYQSLFAFFAAVYLVFAIAGLWLGGSETAVEELIRFVNAYLPRVIGPDGIIRSDEVRDIAQQAAGVLTITGAVALVAVLWTAVGFVTFTRRAVREIFQLPFDDRGYVLLKARDFAGALVFGLALLVGAALAGVATWALDLVFDLVGLGDRTLLTHLVGRGAAVVVAFAINATALVFLIRFLIGTTLPRRRIWPGSLLGGLALVVLQAGAGILVAYTPRNPLLATFAISVGLLLWFRLMGIVILVVAAWIAVTAADAGTPLIEPSEAERVAAEHQALLLAAQVRLRTAEQARSRARWYHVVRADHAVREARRELDEVEASAPPTPGRRRG